MVRVEEENPNLSHIHGGTNSSWYKSRAYTFHINRTTDTFNLDHSGANALTPANARRVISESTGLGRVLQLMVALAFRLPYRIE